MCPPEIEGAHMGPPEIEGAHMGPPEIEGAHMGPPLRVTACPHPFKLANQEYSFAPTISLTQVLKEVQPVVLLRRRAHIWVNDKYVDPGKWDSTFPEAGAEIDIRVVPSGKVGRVIGSVFIAIAAIAVAFLAPWALGLTGMLAGVVGGLAGLAVGIIGNMALNALFPPVSPGGAGTLSSLSAMPGQLDYGQSSPTLSITGAQNKANLWGPVPFILGKFRVAPFCGARTYTESVGGDQYLRLLFVWGFDPVKLEDLRILDTALEYYQGVEIEHRNLTLLMNPGTIAIDVTAKTLTRTYGSWLLDGIKAGDTVSLTGCTTAANDTGYLISDADHQVLTYTTSTATTTEAGNGAQVASVTFGDDPLTLYTVDIQEEALSIELEQNVENVHTSEQDADELSVDVACSSLMGVTSSGGTFEMSVAFEVFARLTGTSDPWAMINRVVVIPGTPATPGTPDIPTYIATPWGPWTDWIIPSQPVIPGTPGTSGSPDVYGSIVLTGNTKSSVRGNVSWKVPVRGQYDVKVKRITAPDTIWTSSVSYWVALRTIKNGDPIDFPHPLAKTAMRIKATGQLNGTVDAFKGTLTSICPDWDADTETWITRPTQNPASLYRKVLQGVQNQKPLADSRIDLLNLQYWHEYCVTQGWKYNKYIDYTATVEDLLREIAAAARSAFSRIDSKVGVIIDEPQTFTIGPAFTPRNILKDSFQSNIAIVNRPHAFRCPFINKDMQYQQDERLVLADGYQIDDKDAWGVSHPEYTPATIFEQLDLPGVTDPELIFRHARYHYAVARLRCETFQFGADIEWMVATRGDRIKFAHDVMLTGLSWGRVKTLVMEIIGYASVTWNFLENLLCSSGVDHPLIWLGGGSPGYTTGLLPGNTAIALDGAHYLSLANHADFNMGAGDFSLEFIIKRNDIGEAWTRLLCNGGGGIGYEVVWNPANNPGLNITDSSGNDLFWSTSVIGDLAYHYLGISVNRDGNIIFCVDGVCDTVAATRPGSLDNAQDTSIGSQAGIGGSYSNCNFDLVRIHKGPALSAAEMSANYAGFQLGEAGEDAPIFSGKLGGVSTDEILPMQVGESYILRFRLADNTSLLCPIVTAAGEPKAATFITPIAAAEDWPAVGDLFLFGAADLEGVDLLIKSIQPNSDLSATVIAVPYDENIYLADVGTIPAHDPKISTPPEWWSPVISWIRSDGTVLFPIPGGGWQSRILVTLQRPSALDSQITGVEAQFWVTGSDGTPITLPVVSLDAGEVSILPVTDGQSYDFRLRYVKKDGTRGPWGATETEVVEGKTAPPSAVTGFYVMQLENLITALWTSIPDLDRAGYEIRYGEVGESWAVGILVNGEYKGNSFTTTNIPPGTWDVMIKALDTSGNYSTTEARKTLQVYQFYALLSSLEHRPLWEGTLINLVRNPLTGNLNPDDQDIPSGDDFDVFDNYVVNPYSDISYTTPEIDLGSDKVARAWARIYSNLGVGETGIKAPLLSLDYKLDGGAYDGFEDWGIGYFEGRYAKFKVSIDPAVGLLRLTGFQPTIDQAA